MRHVVGHQCAAHRHHRIARHAAARMAQIELAVGQVQIERRVLDQHIARQKPVHLDVGLGVDPARHRQIGQPAQRHATAVGKFTEAVEQGVERQRFTRQLEIKTRTPAPACLCVALQRCPRHRHNEITQRRRVAVRHYPRFNAQRRARCLAVHHFGRTEFEARRPVHAGTRRQAC